MTEILDNFVLQLILPFVGAVGVIFGIVVWFVDIRGKRKALCYVVLKHEWFQDKKTVLEIRACYSDREQLSGRDKQRKLFIDKLGLNVHLVVVGVLISGKVPIAPKDYGDPRYGIKVSLGANAEIWAANIYEANARSLRSIIESRSPQRVTLKPMLLNPSDWFILELQCWRFDGQINVSGRIAGIKSIPRCSQWSFCRRTKQTPQSLHTLDRQT